MKQQRRHTIQCCGYTQIFSCDIIPGFASLELIKCSVCRNVFGEIRCDSGLPSLIKKSKIHAPTLSPDDDVRKVIVQITKLPPIVAGKRTSVAAPSASTGKYSYPMNFHVNDITDGKLMYASFDGSLRIDSNSPLSDDDIVHASQMYVNETIPEMLPNLEGTVLVSFPAINEES